MVQQCCQHRDQHQFPVEVCEHQNQNYLTYLGRKEIINLLTALLDLDWIFSISTEIPYKSFSERIIICINISHMSRRLSYCTHDKNGCAEANPLFPCSGVIFTIAHKHQHDLYTVVSTIRTYVDAMSS